MGRCGQLLWIVMGACAHDWVWRGDKVRGRAEPGEGFSEERGPFQGRVGVWRTWARGRG
jgi:hypothetical protein